MAITSRCGHFKAMAAIGDELVSGSLLDSRGRPIKAFIVKRRKHEFVVSVGGSGQKVRFDIISKKGGT
jgi:hypothetical protein